MIIYSEPASPGVFFMTLEEPIDFQRRTEDREFAWKCGIGWLKRDIHRDQRSYDKATKVWTIRDTLENRTITQTIKEVFFVDKNQLKLI